MITFGLTGGIASGKSTVSTTLRENDIPIVDADIIAREVVVPGSAGNQLIVDAFGKDYLLDNGELDRPKLGNLVFHNKIAMDMINHIMQPLIMQAADDQITALHQAGQKIVGYDGALLIEQGIAHKFNPLIVVHCPVAMQLERLMKRNSLTHEQAMGRINSQMSAEEKIKHATYVIDTSGTIENSIAQTKKIIHYLHREKFKQMLSSGEMTYNQVPYPWRDTMGNDTNWDDE